MASKMTYTISELTHLWSQTLKLVKQKLDENQIFDSFFAETYADDVHGDTIDVVVNSALAKQLLSGKYLELLSDCVEEIFNYNYSLQFIEENNKSTKVTANLETVVDTIYFKDSRLNPSLTFDTFVVGSFNKEAHQAASLVANKPGEMFNPLFIYSESGLGKTHLLEAVGNYIVASTNKKKKVLYISAQDFFDEYVKYIKAEKDAQNLMDFISEFDVLLFDDVQMLANRLKTQDMFFSVYEKLLKMGKQIVITSDRQPNELNNFQDRLITRFSNGLLVNIFTPDRNTCIEICKAKLEKYNLNISRFDERIFGLFADKFSKSIRELEGAVNRLYFSTMSLPADQEISFDYGVAAASGLVSGNAMKSSINENKIINVVADYFKLSPNQLTGTSRTKEIATARHVAMYFIYHTLDVSLEKTGNLLGGKDHTTVMNGISKVDKALKTSEEMNIIVKDIQARLKAK